MKCVLGWIEGERDSQVITVHRVNAAHIKYCAQQITAFDAQFNYCALITSSSNCVRGSRVCNLPGFWEGWCCYFQAGQLLRDARCGQYCRQVQSLFRHQPRTVLSWLQSVTLISANRHV